MADEIPFTDCIHCKHFFDCAYGHKENGCVGYEEREDRKDDEEDGNV